MELTVPLISLPAIVALILKAAIYAYVRLVRITRNLETRLFFLFLLALAAQNVSEIAVGYRLNVGNSMPHDEARFFYVAMILGIALLFHLSAVLALPEQRLPRKLFPVVVYLWAAALIVLVFTPWLIRDFVVLDYGFGLSATRVPGQLYFLFEWYGIVSLLGVIILTTYGWKTQRNDRMRAKILVFLVAIVPTVVVILLAIGLLHFGVKWLNATVTVPVTITYFLVVSCYGIHHRRFLDFHDGLAELAALRERSENNPQPSTNGHSGQPRYRTWVDLVTPKTLNEQVAELEAHLILQALHASKGNQAKAASLLGLRPNTFHYKMERYGMARRKPRR